MSNEIPRCPECKELMGIIEHGWACEKCRYLILDNPLVLEAIGKQGSVTIEWFGIKKTFNDEELKELTENPSKLIIRFPKEESVNAKETT